ncbi:MAG: hypothetical protein GF411_16640 [Candidatus Lokiarchaeota archaeon]|nr:hypothetical protein [Candidatus Lokiarchaeota archaeon]
MTRRPKKAIVRKPPPTYRDCISDHPERKNVDWQIAIAQHAAYCQTLIDLGLDLYQLPQLDEHPDSCFVEDTAIVYQNKALITRLARATRRGEEKEVADILQESFETKYVKEPATIEGGDVIHLSNHLIVGRTQRTDNRGISYLSDWFDVDVTIIDSPKVIHLKSHVTALSDDLLITTKEFSEHPAFDEFDIILVPDDEKYAANTLVIGRTVLMPKGYEKTTRLIQDLGFSIILLDTSEFEKCEGALTCLSIIY